MSQLESLGYAKLSPTEMQLLQEAEDKINKQRTATELVYLMALQK